MSKRQRIIFMAAFVIVATVMGVLASSSLQAPQRFHFPLSFDAIRVQAEDQQPRDVVGLIYGLSEVDNHNRITHWHERRHFFRVKPGNVFNDIPASELMMRSDRSLRMSFLLVHDNAPYTTAEPALNTVADCRNRVLIDLLQFASVRAGANCGVRLIFGMIPPDAWIAEPVDRTFSTNWLNGVRSVDEQVQMQDQMQVNAMAYQIDYTLDFREPQLDSNTAAKLLVE